MKIVFATGIYPPDIGGPALYCAALAEKLAFQGVQVRVCTYGAADGSGSAVPVSRISKTGGPIIRWTRYACELRRHARDADIIYALSSVSAGVPLWLAMLRHPRTVLRLGGDFLWERATDRGETVTLRDWYQRTHWGQSAMNGLLRTFDHLVFSSTFQHDLYHRTYARLPAGSIIENPVASADASLHALHAPMRILFLGRFVAFKNIPALLHALVLVPDAVLTCVGEGPMLSIMQRTIETLDLQQRVHILPPAHGAAKEELMRSHDLLMLPSLTEISPNTALEARSLGMPVLLTEETGLSATFLGGMIVRPLLTARDIAAGITEVREHYHVTAERAASPMAERSWESVTTEHMRLFQSLL